MFRLVQRARNSILHLFPKHLVTLEIGVKAGKYSQAIMKAIHPSSHHMVDPYRVFDDPLYDRDVANRQPHEQLYRATLRLFEAPLSTGQACFYRMTSLEAAELFPDEFFDFIYIDAMHYYQAVLADLQAWSGKLKPGGILAGHDYVLDDESRKAHFGVVEAVSDFVDSSEFELTFLTWEPDPSFFLAKQGSHHIHTINAALREQKVTYIDFDDIYRDKITMSEATNMPVIYGDGLSSDYFRSPST